MHTAPDAVRVLVVDDERAITDLVAMALKYEGFAVATASTAKQARAEVMDFRPALIVLDIGLPDEDGFALVQRLRRGNEDVVPGRAEPLGELRHVHFRSSGRGREIPASCLDNSHL